tara:strand:- start:124 stop:615 length:492 start_codon:yes stop_codon:yes gene_type:complete
MDDYIDIELNNNKVKINRNDSEDIWKWYCESGGRKIKNPYWKKITVTKKNRRYARIKCIKEYSLHRVVYYAHNQEWDMNFKDKLEIDHIDRNAFNNHISNLRLVTHSQNQQNKNVKGYSWNKAERKYRAHISVNGKLRFLGQYKTKEEARQAYLDAKKIYHDW